MASTNIFNYSRDIIEDAEVFLLAVHERDSKMNTKLVQQFGTMFSDRGNGRWRDSLNIACLAIMGNYRPYATNASDEQLQSLVAQLKKRNESLLSAIAEKRAARKAQQQ